MRLCLLKTDLIGLRTKSDYKGRLVQKPSLSAFRIVLICLSQLQTRGASHFQAFPAIYSIYGTVTEKSANFDIVFAKILVVK